MEQLENHQQMVDACQIPEDVYKNMTTEELSQTILAYPLNADMFAYDTCEIGFDTVKEHFNGLQEFCERTDSVSYLIDLYSTQEVVLQSDLDEETVQAFQSDNSIAVTENGKEACKKIFNTLTLSLFLAQDTFVEKMTPVDEHNLANVIYEKMLLFFRIWAKAHRKLQVRSELQRHHVSLLVLTVTIMVRWQ